MADVRSLLRQQRAARRIEHPQAAYSQAGKLLCTLCHETIKTEALWEGHIRSAGHRQRLQVLQARDAAGADPASHKRKHDSDEEDEEEEDEEPELVRRKRSRNDMTVPAPLILNGAEGEREQNLTPPDLVRRMSTTPGQGVEMQIASRPATPVVARDTSTSSTPNLTTPLGPSPLIPQDPTTTPLPPRREDPAQGDVDEDEWAAFEADIAMTSAPAAPFSADAVISAPAMTAAEAAKAEEEGNRRPAGEIQLEDEKEEATMAMEDEFEEMEGLEERVRRLKEKREALRVKGGETVTYTGKAGIGKENVVDGNGDIDVDLDDDEDEDEDEDDWASFRFRG